MAERFFNSSNVVDLGDRRPGLQSGSGGGTYDGMERIDALEKRFDRFENKMDTLIENTSEMKGRLVSVPTIWQLVSINAAMLALVIAGGGIALTILRFIEAAPKP